MNRSHSFGTSNHVPYSRISTVTFLLVLSYGKLLFLSCPSAGTDQPSVLHVVSCMYMFYLVLLSTISLPWASLSFEMFVSKSKAPFISLSGWPFNPGYTADGLQISCTSIAYVTRLSALSAFSKARMLSDGCEI